MQCRTVKLLARNTTDGRGSYNLLISGKFSWSSSIQESGWCYAVSSATFLCSLVCKKLKYLPVLQTQGVECCKLLSAYQKHDMIVLVFSCMVFSLLIKKNIQKNSSEEMHEGIVNLKGKSKTTEWSHWVNKDMAVTWINNKDSSSHR